MKNRAITWVGVVVIVGVLVVLVAVISVAIMWMQEQARRSACSCSLSAIGKALTLYSQDYNGVYPMLPLGKGKIIGEDKAARNLKPNGPDDPFNDFPPNADHSVSKNLWLLVRNNLVSSEVFICPSALQEGDWDNHRLDLKDGKARGEENFVNFPWKDPVGVMAYSFIQPWSRFADDNSTAANWHNDVDSGVVIGGEANNGSQPDYKPETWPPSPSDIRTHSNSTNHFGYGQNLLSGDWHIEWTDTPYVGVDKDNVYTALPSDYKGNPGDTPGILSVRPRDLTDSVLVPNKDAELKEWNRVF